MLSLEHYLEDENMRNYSLYAEVHPCTLTCPHSHPLPLRTCHALQLDKIEENAAGGSASHLHPRPRT